MTSQLHSWIKQLQEVLEHLDYGSYEYDNVNGIKTQMENLVKIMD